MALSMLGPLCRTSYIMMSRPRVLATALSIGEVPQVLVRLHRGHLLEEDWTHDTSTQDQTLGATHLEACQNLPHGRLTEVAALQGHKQFLPFHTCLSLPRSRHLRGEG